MKILYVGGGSPKVLADARLLASVRPVMQDGTIALYDLAPERAEAVAAILRQSPEILAANVTVESGSDLPALAEGADFVEFIIGPWDWHQLSLSGLLCAEQGLMFGENLGIGAPFMAALGGPAALQVARCLETVSPGATMLIFSNPVPVLTALVNRHTSIRTIGICAGVSGHYHDLARIMGWDPPCRDFVVEAAGVNHMSWIQSASIDGEDCLPKLYARLDDGLDLDELARTDPAWNYMGTSFSRMVRAYQICGSIVFSIEGDGIPHTFFYDEYMRELVDTYKSWLERGPNGWGTGYDELAALAHGRIDDDYWQPPGDIRDSAATRIIKALVTGEPDNVTATYINRGAVAEFGDDDVAEYTLRVSADGLGLTDRAPYHLPPATIGVSCGMAEQQRLAADAIAAEDMRKFRQAVYAYPMARNREVVEKLSRGIIEHHRDRLPAWIV